MEIFWLIVFLVLLFFEILTLGLTTIWFAGGALVAFVLAVLNVSWMVQMVVFLVVSFLLLLTTRPFAQKYINKNTTKTNIESVIGKIVKVTADIDNINAMGKASLDGEDWTARSAEDHIIIPAGTYARIVGVEGVKLIVKETGKELEEKNIESI